MKRYRVLSLTDHTNHTSENSIYAILRAMTTHAKCLKVDVASKGNSQNDPFFNQCFTTNLHAISVDNSFDFDISKTQFIKDTFEANLLNYDLYFLRLPRSVTDDFLFWISKQLNSKIVINDPRGIIITSNKSFLLNFPRLCPPIALCKSIKSVIDFSKHHDIVLKPLKEYGGKGIVKITGDILNDGEHDWNTIDYLNKIENNLKKEGYLAMKYLKNVTQGDKRLLVVNGEILASSLRMPPENSWLCNVARGGKSFFTEADEREIEIVNNIAPSLRKHGILMYGVDTLVNDKNERTLSEINTLSIGGFAQADQQTGKEIIKMTLDKMFEATDKYYGQTN